MPDDLAFLQVYWGKCDPRRNNQTSHYSRGGSLNENHSDQLSRGKLPVSLQWSPRQTLVKDPESCHIHSLLDDEVPNYGKDGPSLRKTMELKRMLQKSLELAEKRKELPQTIEVEKTSKGPMKTNIGPLLQEDESTAGPVKEICWLVGSQS